MSICAGLFYTIVLNFMCTALWRSLKLASGEASPDDPRFATQLLDPFFKVSSRLDLGWQRVSSGSVAPQIPSGRELVQYVLAVVAPWWGGSAASVRLSGGKRIWSVPFGFFA